VLLPCQLRVPKVCLFFIVVVEGGSPFVQWLFEDGTDENCRYVVVVEVQDQKMNFVD